MRFSGADSGGFVSFPPACPQSGATHLPALILGDVMLLHSKLHTIVSKVVFECVCMEKRRCRSASFKIEVVLVVPRSVGGPAAGVGYGPLDLVQRKKRCQFIAAKQIMGASMRCFFLSAGVYYVTCNF